MTKSDYDKYYKKGGTYVIPVEIFNELLDEIERLNNIINELEKELELNLPFKVVGVRGLLNKLQELKGSDKE